MSGYRKISETRSRIFNFFKVEPHIGGKSKPLPYKKRDYCKIMITKGDSKVLYADQVVDVNGYALTFSNP